MTVTPTSYTPDIYNGNGSTTAFAVTFPFYTILVTHIDSAGSETVWAETTNYTVAGGSGSTGTVTALVAPASGEKLRIERVTVKSQAEDFDFDNQVTEDSLQNAVDKLAMIMQEQNYDNLRRPAISVANYTSPVEFPAASTGSVLSWDGSGNIANTALVDLNGVAISALTTVSSLENTDLFPLYDTSAGGNKSVTLANLITAVTPTLGALAALDTVDTSQIEDDAVTSAKLADDAIPADLASTTSGKGASLVGIEDSGSLIAATDVEGALAELAASGQKFHIQDQKNTSAQALAATWNVREFNTIIRNEISGASLASNQITLPATTYKVRAWAVAFKGTSHKLRLYDTTNTVELLAGNSPVSHVNYLGASTAHLEGEITLAGTAVLELQHVVQHGGYAATHFNANYTVFANIVIEKVG